PTSSNATGELGIRLLSASGHPVAGQQVTMTSGGAMAITSPARPTDANGSTRAWVQMPSPLDTSVSGQLRVEVHNLPGTVPRLFVPAEATIQRMLAAAPGTSLTWHDTVALEPTPWTPSVSTRTREVIAE